MLALVPKVGAWREQPGCVAQGVCIKQSNPEPNQRGGRPESAATGNPISNTEFIITFSKIRECVIYEPATREGEPDQCRRAAVHLVCFWESLKAVLRLPSPLQRSSGGERQRERARQLGPRRDPARQADQNNRLQPGPLRGQSRPASTPPRLRTP